jgi:hypothetical protein
MLYALGCDRFQMNPRKFNNKFKFKSLNIYCAAGETFQGNSQRWAPKLQKTGDIRHDFRVPSDGSWLPPIRLAAAKRAAA